jgi:hypothetical protein
MTWQEEDGSCPEVLAGVPSWQTPKLCGNPRGDLVINDNTCRNRSTLPWISNEGIRPNQHCVSAALKTRSSDNIGCWSAYVTAKNILYACKYNSTQRSVGYCYLPNDRHAKAVALGNSVVASEPNTSVVDADNFDVTSTVSLMTHAINKAPDTII